MKKEFEELSIEEKNELMKKVQEREGLVSVTEVQLKEEYLKEVCKSETEKQFNDKNYLGAKKIKVRI